MNKLITTIACLICCIVYTQAQNKDNMLSKKEQSIAAISMYAARGNQDSLKVILARGLDCGLTVSEEKEVLTQLYAYCGFPRSMGALVTLMNLTKERAAQGIKDEAGREPSPVKSSICLLSVDKPAETVRSSGTRRSADICSGIGPISESSSVR